MNVEGNPAALDELERLGVPAVPAVAVGDRAVHGWNPEGLARLLGVTVSAAPRLPPEALASRLDLILKSTARLLGRVGPDAIDWTPPERDRTLGDLGYHVFRLSLAFADAVDLGGLPHAWFEEKAPPELHDGGALARYGSLVRARLAGWFDGAAPEEYARIVQTYYGPQSAHDLLERTTWHAAQHLRQLAALAERLGITPLEPLPTDAFRDLPLPVSLC
ncbi:MAG: DinB family protein [Candidatus Rokubacteria bacterium]|nr:DinB family protein [Candidatus Rokubacteria bacterium]